MALDYSRIELTADIIKRFWKYVQKTESCWVWLSKPSVGGYGRLSVNGVPLRAHRISYYLANGKWPMPFCLHSCDNRRCVNPDHLRAGDHASNMRDVALHGTRVGLHAGSRNPSAKLTEDDVRRIREMEGDRYELAAVFNVHPDTIYGIKSGRTWRHIQ